MFGVQEKMGDWELETNKINHYPIKFKCQILSMLLVVIITQLLSIMKINVSFGVNNKMESHFNLN